ncbi:site-specific integrase [Mucilaginibacter roseus]|uniref:Site-specific integrase n=1 Tax=Mucilaginibacter roseus TaxID=1528868 RepID=A0ABS8U1I4_9SPHI|nr:site-specific integrase [Mucilaginibacter roseus]MCD8739712.1 site-specific integrase [Mucilaginibacter roseus]
MKPINTFSVHFNLRTEKGKEGKAPVYAAIKVNGEKAMLALKQSVATRCWDVRKGMGKTTTAEGRELNIYLEEVRQVLGECYRELQLKRRVISADAVKNAFLKSGDDEHTLEEIAEYHNETSKGVLAPATMKNYYTTQKYLREFVSNKLKRKSFFLSELNYKFIQDFEVFLRNHQPVDHQKPLTTNGIMKHLERFKKMINLACRIEWLYRDPFEKYQLKFDRVEKDFLTSDELAALEQKHLLLPRLSVVRDIFVFACYTGLAFIDVMELTPDNLVKGQDGGLWIKTFRQKTTIPVNVPVLNEPERLLNKYKGNVRAAANGTIFPKLSNQKMNSYLKELAELCRINKVLTFHMARHTFATTVTLVNGVPIETVSKLLGHTSMRSTQVYAKVIERKVSEDMAALKGKLKGLSVA